MLSHYHINFLLVFVCSAVYFDFLQSVQAFTPSSSSPRIFSYSTTPPNLNGAVLNPYPSIQLNNRLIIAARPIRQTKQNIIILSAKSNNNGEDKFSFFQRIESIKTAALGAISGGILSTPIIALHDIPLYGPPSWEFDTDMGSLQSALFAIVYRYCVREEDNNDMLNMGVVGAFVAVRTLSRVRVPSYCTAAPLDCGDPLGYFDWDMLGQLVWNGAESVALFGGAALAMEIAYEKKWISKFPN